jgi:hypothetical protein
MPVIPVNRVVDTKRMIGKNGVPRRRRGTKVADPHKMYFVPWRRLGLVVSSPPAENGVVGSNPTRVFVAW